MLCDLINAEVDEDVHELVEYNTSMFKRIIDRNPEPKLWTMDECELMGAGL